MRTKEEIKEEIEKLRSIEQRVRSHTAFGDDNKGAVHVQLKVLEKDISKYHIYDAFGHDEYILEEALYARRWLDEEEEAPPSIDWEPLCSPKE